MGIRASDSANTNVHLPHSGDDACHIRHALECVAETVVTPLRRKTTTTPVASPPDTDSRAASQPLVPPPSRARHMRFPILIAGNTHVHVASRGRSHTAHTRAWRERGLSTELADQAAIASAWLDRCAVADAVPSRKEPTL